MEIMKVNIMKLEKKNEGEDGFNKTIAKLDFSSMF